MYELSAVAAARMASAERSVPSSLARMPATQFSAPLALYLDARGVEDPRRGASSLIQSSRLRAISGTRTLSSKLPCMPPIVIAVSLPITWAET